MIGKRLAHYQILQKLGRGGMAEIYVAQDTRLGRRVALKLLRPEVAGSPDRRERLEREAKAAAALNHPNIVHVYSVEESEGLLFITMELVDGRSLREILSEARLPPAKTLAFACQIAEGLMSAHAAGVLHRDLKPGNVMITGDDRVKILDFGLAKLFTGASGWDPEAATLVRESSSPGMTLGTVGYMSPEQALGKKVDPRTDLFALGVVVFEMATGRAPFQGETLAAVFDELLNRPPPSPQTLNPALPEALTAILEKALEKDPKRRYQSAKELLEDLRRVDPSRPGDASAVSAPSEARRPSSLVVLPFLDMSPQKDQEYFCHGLTEELINTLTRVPGLRVISRTSAFAFQGKGLELTEIGRRLKVGTALEGSVRKAGNRVRITAQLVNAEDGYQMWSQRFDRELSDVFAIQDEIAATIVNELSSEFSGAAPDKSVPGNLEAYEAYLKGIYARNLWTEETMGRAIASFQEAVARDPGFAPAYAALAEGYVWLYSGIGILPAKDTVPEARRAVEKALLLDPRLAEAHKVRGLIAMNHDWDRIEAEKGLTRAIELSPSSAAAHLWNAWRLALLEAQYGQALVELEEAERLDPLDLQIKTQIGYVYYFLHDLDRAIGQFEKTLALEPSFAFAHYGLGDAYTQKGLYDQAIAEFKKAIELKGRSINTVSVLGYAQGRAGNVEEAKSLLAELTARSAGGYVPAIWIALVHLGLGDLENLFLWLERAFEERDGSLILITSAIEFDPVREDPRFKSLLERMGLGDLASRPR